MMTVSKSAIVRVLATLAIGTLVCGSVTAKNLGEIRRKLASSQLAAPDLQVRVHKTGNVQFMITNSGKWGNLADQSILDPETGLPGASCQYPAGSGIEHLFLGALWLGAVVDGDTLTSLGHDGWQNVFELFPDDGATSNIIKRSNLPASPYYSPLAISEADYIATTYDTLTAPAYAAPDPYDNRPHAPLGLKIVQESYSWSASGLDNFVIVKERVFNIGQHQLNGMCAGLYFDSDVGHPSTYNYFQDDISGSVTVPADATGRETMAGWIADNDGDPFSGLFNYRSALTAFGVSVIEQPVTGVSYNWWISNGDAARDWGPSRIGETWPFSTGGTGTPSGDRNKYALMRRTSRDYDQLWSAVDMSSLGWKPPNPASQLAADIADGYDTKFLLSFDLGELAPGDSTEFVFVVAIGDNVHESSSDFLQYFSAQYPQAFAGKLNLTGLQETIQRARRQYMLVTTGLLGDANSDLRINVSDAVFLIRYIFLQGTAPGKPNLADVNADCQISMADIVYLVNFIFASGPYPKLGCAAK